VSQDSGTLLGLPTRGNHPFDEHSPRGLKVSSSARNKVLYYSIRKEMTDVSVYTNKKREVQDLYHALHNARIELKRMEICLIEEWKRTSQPFRVISDSIPVRIKVQERHRRIPLTQNDLGTKIAECLFERFGAQVPPAEITEFAQTVTKRIWSERRIRRETMVLILTEKEA